MAIAAFTLLQSCIEDGVTTSPSDRPQFSTDTLKLGTVWTDTPSPTCRFTVYNPHDKILNLSRVSFRDDPYYAFRLNVDGTAGREITDVEVRPNDSIFVFVEATLPPTGVPQSVAVTSHIDFLVNGQISTVAVTADACDLKRLKAAVITSDTTFTAEYPIGVTDSLVVMSGATLTLEPGVRLLFHDKATMTVRGTLVALGSPDRRIDMTGDRTGSVVASIPYDIMSNQWGGLRFAAGSTGNMLHFTTVRNSAYGVMLDSLATLDMRGAILRNAASYPLLAVAAEVTAAGCEIAEGGDGVIALSGGSYRFDHCTVANHYLFSVIGGPAIQMDLRQGTPSQLKARFTNTIIYGLGDDLAKVSLKDMDVTFARCILKSSGTDDDNFVRCLWDTDPLYLLDRSRYIFDYHVKEGSPAEGEAMASEFAPVLSPDGQNVDGMIGAWGTGR